MTGMMLRSETRRVAPSPGHVVLRISEQAVCNRDRPALASAGGTITYGELDRSAGSIAASLVAAGVGRGDVVAVHLPRSVGEVVARLAVMRAGAAFLPLDPDWPAERVARMLALAGRPLVLGDAPGCARAAAAGCRWLDAGSAPAPAAAGDPAAAVAIGADDVAYAIFTSGSTGEPKCVELTHGNLSHLVDWHLAAFGVGPDDRASHVAGLAFDAAVWEVWPALCAGATVVLAEDAVRASPELLQEWLVRERITMAYVPTVLAQSMIRMPWPIATRLRHLLTGGEALRAHPLAGLPFAVTNCYGPTECTVVATAGLVPPEPAEAGLLPTIGRAIAGAGAWIMNEHGAPVAAGQAGELWVTGGGVGLGYRGDLALTAERFVVAGRDASNAGIRAYRTGDLVRERDDGEIMFVGRLDRQEKIRGVRIETDEIVAALSTHPKVAWSEVIGAGEGADRRLVAYVLPARGEEPSGAELRTFLAAKLPAALVPASFLRLETVPLTSSGKLDRARLPDPDDAERLAGDDFRAPSTPTEQRLAEIIGGILGIAEVGADDNFFLLGGHSLLGTQVVLRARDAFGVELTLRHLFGAQTVAELAVVIEGMALALVATLRDEDAASLVAD